MGYLFSAINYLYVQKRKKYLRSSHVDGKREIACFYVETQPATGKREKWRESRGHVINFAVRISRIRDAKSLYCNRFLARETLQPVLSAGSSATDS